MLRNIVVADSDVASRDRFYEILSSMGYKVECTPNSKEALTRLKEERPYLLILEQNLVPEDGLKTLEKIRGFDREMQVVFLTRDEPEAELERKAQQLGVSAVVKKDFLSHLMFKKILEILRQPLEEVLKEDYSGLGKILVVDDNSEMRVTLTTFLTKKGFAVQDVVNGEQALMEMQVGKPRLVLLDERMPGMDGLIVLKKIKEMDSSIKVVMLTAVEDEDIIKEAEKLGASDYITKPFDFQKLEALIISILIQDKYKT